MPAPRNLSTLHRSEERQKAEKLESLGIVAGGIAHDFNNLLTAILGNISLALLDPEIAAKTGSRLAAAKSATNRAQELARQLLTFARGGAPIKQTASVAQLVRDTASCTLRDSRAVCELPSQTISGLPEVLAAPKRPKGRLSRLRRTQDGVASYHLSEISSLVRHPLHAIASHQWPSF